MDVISLQKVYTYCILIQILNTQKLKLMFKLKEFRIIKINQNQFIILTGLVFILLAKYKK